MFKRALALSCAALLTLLGVLGTGQTASAAPPTEPWSGSAGGDVANVGLSVVGLTLANARLANSSATSSSTASPRSQSISRNIAAAVAGLPISVASTSQTAPPDNPGPVSGNLAAVNAVGIGVNALTTSNEAHWSGDSACVTTTPLSSATTTTAGLSVNPLGLANILTSGVSSTTGTTSLVSTGGNGLNRAVQSQARGSAAGISLLGGAVTVEVAGEGVLTARAAGTTGNATVSYTAPIVRVTSGGTTQTVALGSGVTLDLGAVGLVQVSNNNPTQTTAANGTTATASVNVVSLTVRAGPAALPVANATVQVLPLRATAIAPSGGIDCPPPAPVLEVPADDSITNDSSPTFSGTGVLGASINLTLDGTTIPNAAIVRAGGTWSYTPTVPIVDGAHAASATQTLNGATSPPSNENAFTIDTVPPAAPVVEQPVNNSTTGDDTPTISGTGPANTTIRVFVDGASIGTTTSSATGTWQYVSRGLTDGSHTTYAVATDAAENNSVPSNTNTFIVDTTAPAAPVIATPADGSTITDTTPTITGTGEPGATLTVSLDGAELGTQVIPAGGAWSVPVTTPLADGPHTVEAQQTDPSGNESATASNDFTVDTTAPGAPVVTAPADGATTGATPTVTGTAEADADVEVFIDGASIGTTTADADGDWQLPVTTALTTGTHEVYAVATDPAGNVSDPSDTNTFTVDTTAPAAPVLNTPADGSVGNDTTPTFTGTAEPGAEVEVFVDGTSIGTTTATGGGTFSLDAATALTAGSHEAYAVATDEAGNASDPSNTNTFTIDTTAPAAPTITAPADGSTITDSTPDISGTGEPGATVAVSIDGTPVGTAVVTGGGTWTVPVATALGEGSHDVVAVQTDPAGNESDPATSSFTVDTTPPAAPVVVTPADGATTNATPTVTGTSEPSVDVEVFIDGDSAGTVTADAAGDWELAITNALSPGTHEVYAVASDAAGNESAPSNTNTFTVDTTAPTAPVLTTPADGSVGNDTTPTLAGTAEAGASVEVFVDGASIGTTTATAGGTFTLDAPTALTAGSHEAYAVATDAVGNVSAPSNTNTFTIDTTAPGAPVITAPADGSSITDPTPTVTGTGEAGATVTVSIDGTEIGTTPVDGGGAWSLPVIDPLGDGPHTVTATQTDPAGNTSDPASNDFTVDGTPPGAPVVTAPANGATTGATPTVVGTAEALSDVEVFVDGDSIGTVAVDAAGNWQLAVTDPLASGVHEVYAVATDAAGNESAPSNTNIFTVDADAPVAPVLVVPADGSSTNDTTPTFSGTAEPGSSVQVFVDGTSVGTTTATAGGTFSLDATATLAAGPHEAYAIATDDFGNASLPSNTNTFTIDTTVPGAPVITAPAHGSTIGDPTPDVTGTGEPGAAVTVTVDGTLLGTTPVAGDGSWTLPVTTPLGDGPHTVTAIQTDPAGNASGPAENDFTVDTTAPAAPVITNPVDGATLDDATPTVTGTGEPGATVTVSIDGTEIADDVAVGNDGTWSLPLTTPLADGPHTVTAIQTDPTGNASGPAENDFTVDTTAPTTPIITAPVNGSTIGDNTPDITGTGEAGATVTVTIDGDALLTTVVEDDGTWTVPVTTPLGDGPHTVTATQTDVAGNQSDADDVNFTVDTTAPTAPVITAPVDGSTIGDPTPLITGTGEAGATVTVSIDGTELGTTPVAGDGTWTFPVLTALGDGPHTVTAIQTDRAGNASGPAENDFTVDTAAPAAPAITAPVDGSTINDNTPTVTGTGEPGATVTVSIDGTEVADDVAVGDDGTWSLPLTDELADGPHTVTVVQTDPSGNVSAPVENDFTVDTAAPAAPVITAPANGSTINDPTPLVTGTGEAGATVAVTVDGTLLGTTPVAADGTWSIPVTTALGDGPHTVTAIQTDPAGNASDPADNDFTVDTTAPAAPVITNPVDGSTLDDATPTITGTGEPGATVTVSVDGTELGTATVGGDGSWTIQVTTPLGDGPHTVTATQTDPAGNTSGEAENDFTVDTTAPDAPIITAPANGSTISDNTPDITGTGEAGATVTVTIDGDELLTTVVGDDGTWTVPVTAPLGDGPHTVSATQTDVAGNQSDADDVTFTVDTAAPAAPVITAPVDGSTIGDATPTVSGTGEPGAVVTVTLDGTELGTTPVAGDGTWSLPVTTPLEDGPHTVTAIQTDPAGNASGPDEADFTVDTTAPAAPAITAPADGSTIADSTPTVTGTGEPGATITVSIDGDEIADDVAVGDDGTWSLPLTEELADGPHSVTANQTDPSGNQSASTTNDFTVDTTAPTAPVLDTPADGSVGNDTTPTFTGTAEAGASVEIFVDGTSIGTTTATAGGTFTLDAPAVLTAGDHEAYAVATDAVGNFSPPSNTNTFTIDTTAPAAPVITNPADGSTTNDTTPDITGTGEAGATVTVTVDGTELGTTSVAGDGTWTLPVTTPLGDGPHTVSATQTDPAGNTSGPASNDFTVDTTAPAAPVISNPVDGATVDDSTPTITGTGEPGATVTVTIDGDPVGTAPVGDDGTWTLPVTTPLSDGPHTVIATQTDPAGNTSDPAQVDFTVDATAPAAPIITAPTNGSTIGDNTPDITGTGEPGATVTVIIDNDELLTAVVGGDGTWTVPVTAPLGDGPHTVSATQTDVAGNQSDADDVSFTVDTAAPAAPVITAPVDGSTIGDATPTVSGTGEPGATVTVTLDGTELGTAPVAGDGTWSLPVTTPLGDGPHTVTAIQTDPAGNASGPDEADFTVDTTAPAAPAITAPADGSTISDSTPTVTGTGEPGATVTVSVDGDEIADDVQVGDDGTWSLPLTEELADGPHSVTANQTDPSGNQSGSTTNDFTVDTTAPTAPVLTTPADGSVGNDTTPTFTGTAEAGASVEIFVDGASIGTTTATAGGTFSLDAPTALTAGDHEAYAVGTDGVGNVSQPSNTNTFTIDTTAPAAPVITNPVDGSTLDDSTPTVTGTGEPGSTVTVSIDGTELGTAPVAGDGSWTIQVTSPLGDGPHTVTATQTDPAGNVSDPASNDFTVDTTAPDAPVITAPTNGSTIGDNTPDVTGTGEPGATITVTIDGDQPLTTVVGDDGTWTVPVTTPLGDGPHLVAATQTDVAGNQSDADSITFTVDTTAPTAPVLNTPANGSVSNDTTPTFSGTAEAGASVEVFVDGASIGTTTATAGGTFTLDALTALTAGDHQAYAIATDTAGNPSQQSNTNTFTIDTTAPAAPVITAPADGSTVGDPTPTITGTGEPGATITVSIDGDAIADDVQVGDDGTWSLPLTEELADGPHTVTAVQTDPAGNTSAPAENDFTVDTAAPTAPVLVNPADGSTTNDTTPTFTGTAEDGASVEVFVDGASIGTTTATAGGTFSLDAPTELATGDHQAYAVATDGVANASQQSNTNTFTIDTTAPAAPVITAPANGSTTGDPTPDVTGTGEPGATVTVTLDGAEVGTVTVGDDGTWSLPITTPLGDGPHTITATQTDPAGNTSPESDPITFTVDLTAPAAPVITAPADGSVTDDNTPTVTGTGEPGATVTVSIDGDEIADDVQVGDDGTWSLPLTDELSNGQHTVTATQTDPYGNTSEPTSNDFTVDTTPPPPPVVVEPANGSTVGTSTPTISGTGPADTTITVSVDGTVIGDVTSNGSGAWEIDVPAPGLDNGQHSAYAVATDPAGNVSERSNTNTFTIDDTTAPAAPVITSPDDGDRTDDPTPTITGTAEPGSTVTVLIDGQPVGTAPVDEDGNWTFTPTTPLSEGEHTITAIATDGAGNASEPSAPVIITVVEISDPVITTPADNSTVTTRTPTIGGIGEPGARIEVRYVTVTGAGATADRLAAAAVSAAVDPGDLAGETTVGTNGAWSFVVPDPVAPGTYTVQATQSVSGFDDRTSNQQRFRVAAEPTTQAPVITSPTPGSQTPPSFRVCGTGEPGATITVQDENRNSLATVVVPRNGKWCVSVQLPPGNHQITAVQVVDGKELRSAPISIIVTSGSNGGGNGGGGNGGGGNGGGNGGGTNPKPGGLANTGGPALGLGLLGLGLLGSGAALLIHRRRRGIGQG